MEDLSLHILDIVENATNAGATLVEIEITENKPKDLLYIRIRDNGRGMDDEMAKKARDPFVTTRTTRRIGLGLSLLEQAAHDTGGDLSIKSEQGQGTEVMVTFQASHIDRKPMGDMGATLTTLISGNRNVDFVYLSNFNGKEIELDTREIRAQLEDPLTLNHPAVLGLIRDLFKKDRESRDNSHPNAAKVEGAADPRRQR